MSREKVKELFDVALKLDSGQRAEFLERASRGNLELRREVESLIQSHEEADGFLSDPALEVAAGMVAKDTVQLETGQVIGSYEILDSIGSGGMGEVYQARDAKLGRDVAIKVLRGAFSQDKQRLGRFQREAQILASVSHPNIAGIYALEDWEGMDFLALELVAGETLSKVLEKSPLSTEKGLGICRQIAEGLGAAHDRGIIHRDLKPANIKITPEGKVKVLDFGLAKAFERETPQEDLSRSPTGGTTESGVILGTAAYMSPEQARGKSVDKRTDIWAFGCVLYECLVAKQPFGGETPTDILAAIVHEEPDFDRLPAETPSAIVRLLRRCLQKDPARRLHDIADARIEIDETLTDSKEASSAAPVRAQSLPFWRLSWIPLILVSVVVSLLTGIIALVLMRPDSEERRQVTRFAITTPPSAALQVTQLHNDIAISADGTHIAYVCQAGTQQQLCLRAVDELEAVRISATEGSFLVNPFFSHDGSEIGFDGDQALKKISVRDGRVTILRADSNYLFGASWGEDETIIYGSPNRALYRITAPGEKPAPLSILDKEKNERAHVWPDVLPGGKAILFTVLAQGNRQVAVLDPVTRKHRILFLGSNPRYSPSGHIVYSHEATLWAVAFDPEELVVTGVPVAVLENLETKTNGAANFCLSDEGTLVYVPQNLGSEQRVLVWVDRKGKEYPLDAEPRPYNGPRISPDGRRVALQMDDPSDSDVWLYDIERDSEVRLTRSAAPECFPIWTPDGERIVYSSTRRSAGRGLDLYWQKHDGSGDVELLASDPGSLFPSSISADGLQVLFVNLNHESADIGVVSIEGERTQQLILTDSFNEIRPEISPDGNWLAYQSDESDEWEIYVRPFPAVKEGKWKVSTNGGSDPAWAPDGRELFYRNGNRMMAVPIQTESSFRSSKPEVLFEGRYLARVSRHYDVSADGQRFLMIKEGEDEDRLPEIIVVQNWAEELKSIASH